jgi:hypothetical protein
MAGGSSASNPHYSYDWRHARGRFARLALAGSAVEAAKRSLLLTIDFEAFNHKARSSYGSSPLSDGPIARERRCGVSRVFLALEDVVR